MYISNEFKKHTSSVSYVDNSLEYIVKLEAFRTLLNDHKAKLLYIFYHNIDINQHLLDRNQQHPQPAIHVVNNNQNNQNNHQNNNVQNMIQNMYNHNIHNNNINNY